MTYVKSYLLILIGIFSLLGCVPSEGTPPLKMEILLEEETVQPGRPFWIAVHCEVQPGWHIYWKNPGDVGIPLEVKWDLPPELKIISEEWTLPERFGSDGLVGFGYSHHAAILVQVHPSPSLEIGKKLDLIANAHWLVCSDSTCLPGSRTYPISIATTADTPRLNAAAEPLFSKIRDELPLSHAASVLFRSDGILEIQMPWLPGGQSIVKADFFPEDGRFINYDLPASVVQQGDSLIVRVEAENLPDQRRLKGVVILETASDRSYAFQIDSPIDEDEVALLNKKEVKIYPSSSEEQGLAWTLFFAFIGGMILNLMPCVLPVLSFKIMNFVKMSGQNRWVSFRHGVLFSVGVLVSFWILAGVILGLQAYGSTVGWGFQLQEPMFVAALASFLLLFALSSFGVFELGTGVASLAGEAHSSSRAENFNSFCSGIFATAVATPCTGPFLGTVMGLAVTLPFIQSLSVFTAVALGLCSPYLLLAGFPSLLRFIPKPGPWMGTFKQFMGFILLATVLWLVWVFSAETNSLAVFCLLGSFLLFSIGAWIFGQWGTPVSKRRTRYVAYAFVMLFAVGGVSLIAMPRSTWNSEQIQPSHWKEIGWESFSPERVAELQKQGVPVLIDFTAKWCLVCQANHLVLSSNSVDQKMTDSGVVKMKADWTKSDPVITKELAKFGRNSVPLYVLYGGKEGEEPKILPQVLTPEIVMNSVDSIQSDEKIN